MGQEMRVKGLHGLMAALRRDLPKLVRKPAMRAARIAAAITMAHDVVQNMPIAFGELRRSVHVAVTKNGAMVVADAPHAAAVEMGSRPHVVPLEALVKWVKLRGMQGLSKTGQVRSPSRKAWGNTTARHSFAIATAIKATERNGSVAVDEAVKIAKAIQRAIKLHGTKPHHFMRKALPAARRYLDEAMQKALHTT